MLWRAFPNRSSEARENRSLGTRGQRRTAWLADPIRVWFIGWFSNSVGWFPNRVWEPSFRETLFRTPRSAFHPRMTAGACSRKVYLAEPAFAPTRRLPLAPVCGVLWPTNTPNPIPSPKRESVIGGRPRVALTQWARPLTIPNASLVLISPRPQIAERLSPGMDGTRGREEGRRQTLQFTKNNSIHGATGRRG
jgi:hypothetical protein